LLKRMGMAQWYAVRKMRKLFYAPQKWVVKYAKRWILRVGSAIRSHKLTIEQVPLSFWRVGSPIRSHKLTIEQVPLSFWTVCIRAIDWQVYPTLP
jgi:hypothetical protein